MSRYQSSYNYASVDAADQIDICFDGVMYRFDNAEYYFTTIDGPGGAIGCIVINTKSDRYLKQRLFTMDRVDWVEVTKNIQNQEEKKNEN